MTLSEQIGLSHLAMSLAFRNAKPVPLLQRRKEVLIETVGAHIDRSIHISLTMPVRGFKTLKTAYAAINGFEVMRALRKGQAGLFAVQDGTVGEARLVERAFGLRPRSWCCYRTDWPMQKHKATTFPPRSPHPFVRFATEPLRFLNLSLPKTRFSRETLQHRMARCGSLQ